MNRFTTRLAAVATVGAALALAPAALAQSPGATGGSPAPATPRPQRIVIVNIAKVLRDYNKANFQGSEITKKRQFYVSKVNALKEQIAAINKEFSDSKVPEQKQALQQKALGVQRQIEDIDRQAQQELTTLSNDTIVRVYQEIKGVIADIAKTNNLDMVLCYPAASKTEDDNSPAVAQLMLQTPALIPFYHQKMDITDVVVQTLNARYPSPAPPKIEPTGGTGTPMPPIPMGKGPG
ncbi:MAG TPA: OmpH family outer membrane protein [Gemmataceae bacterium]|nr:OmpH family outer membrane protein [Gemmataceae bacterium]